ncbi:MAG TPA: cyclic nucleotide-binding domain-containing protein [Gammaproteobacteria bacterium]|nr:cyclic nucleotide-binding domain-containing protein [Gammaproteobacteria bacterium]
MIQQPSSLDSTDRTLRAARQAHAQDVSAAIARIEVLANLPREYLQTLVGAADVVHYGANATVVGHGGSPHVLFLLRGTVTAKSADGQSLRYDANQAPVAHPVYQSGDPTELSTVRPSTLLRFPHAVYLRQLGLATTASPQRGAEVHYLEDWDQMDGLERALSFGALSHVPPANIQQILSRIEEIPVSPGELVFAQDLPAHGYYIVKSGTAEVWRADTHGRRYRLAVKVPGDAFGDDALVLEGLRSANVSMLTAGTLMRISNEDFSSLIRAPLLRTLSRAQTDALLEGNGRWLDLRDAEQFAAGAQPGALNVPISLLRLKRRALASDVSYLVYAEDRHTEELGCYLLAECGLNAYMLEEPLAEYHRPPAPSAPDPATLDALLGAIAAPLDVSTTQDIRRHARDEAPPPLLEVAEGVDLKALLQVERLRYERLLAERTRIIKEAVERQANEQLAKKDAEMREQVLAKMRVLREERDRLLAHAKQLDEQRKALHAERVALDAESRALEALRKAVEATA